MSIGSLIRKLRKDRNLTQGQLAEIIEVDTRRLSFYENDRMVPSTEVLLRFSKFFGVATDYLLGGEPDALKRLTFDDRELLSLAQRVDRLPEEQRAVVKEVLRAFIFKNKIQDLSRLEGG